MPRSRLAIVLTLLVAALLAARADALYLSLDFSIDRQTYNWADSLSLQKQLGKRSTLELFNRSSATLFQESIFGGGGDRWQKTAITQGALNYRFSSSFIGGVAVTQDFDRLEEKRFIGNRAFLTADFYQTRYRIRQRGGVVWEERKFEPLSHRETGLAYEADFSVTPGGRWGQARVTGEVTTLRRTPRRAVTVGYELPRLTYRGDTLSLSASQTLALRKYFPSSGNFESTARQASEQRRWDLSAAKNLPLAARLAFAAAYRYDRYDYEYQGLTSDFIRQNDNLTSVLEYQVTLQRSFGNLGVSVAYLFNRTKEDFGSSLTNQLAETGQVTARANFTLPEADTLEVSGRIGVTAFFAPTNSAFFADRDRSIRLASFRAVHKFSDFLTGVLDGSARTFHSIYISGSLSANNSINNVYIVNPSLIWQPLRPLRVQQNYQMHANYIYYEYEKNAVSDRNTLYRRANLANTLTITLSARTDLILEYSYRYEDFGRLLWEDQWKQQVSWDRRTHRPRFGVEYRPLAGLRFYPYASYEWQTYYDHLFDPAETLGRRIRTDELQRRLIGFEFQWTMSQNSYIDCRLERRVQEYQRQRGQEYDVFTIALKRYL